MPQDPHQTQQTVRTISGDSIQNYHDGFLPHPIQLIIH